LASFDLCLEHGCDGFEFDVRGTADGEAVVSHDATMARVRIADHRGVELAALRDKGLLPSLEGVLERYAARCFLDVEIKEPGFEAKVAELLRRSSPRHGYVVSSFLPQVLLDMQRVAPEIPRGFIVDDAEELLTGGDLPAHYLIPHRKLVDAELVQGIHAVGKKILVWTVNVPEEMTRLDALGVDGIISDETERLVRVCRR
jgi:glycerophosphoryl diester phosphodiesterase